MYTVGLANTAAEAQVAALPAAALPAFAELRVALETAPWGGKQYMPGRPDGKTRTMAFGEAGMVLYLVLERERRVEILEVLWAS